MSWRKYDESPIVARLVGGLGNQLFIYAAGLEQARRLGVGLKVDTSFYRTHTDRVYGLDQLFKPSLHEANLSEMRNKSKISHPLLRQFNPVREFKEKSHSFQPEIFNIRPGTTIEGFFQSPKYFPSVGGEIARSIRNVIVSESEQSIIDDVSSSPFIAIHVRRGDYLSESHIRKFHGLTTRKYYEASLRIVGGKGVPCIVFTDSPEETGKELRGMRELVFDSRVIPLGQLATLKLMSHASGIVMSNSSFSWWAAYTLSHFNPDSTVISPRPWTQQVYFNEELINHLWWNLGL